MKYFIEYDKAQKNFLKIRDKRYSTNEMKDLLHEYSNRAKRRLERLEGFGLIHSSEKKIGKRINHKWYLTHAGLYFLLSSFSNNKRRMKFISNNMEKSHLVLLLKNKVSAKQIEFLVRNIRKCVRTQQYHEIMTVVRNFVQEIEKKYVDWTVELVPDSRSERYNHETGTYELF